MYSKRVLLLVGTVVGLIIILVGSFISININNPKKPLPTLAGIDQSDIDRLKNMTKKEESISTFPALTPQKNKSESKLPLKLVWQQDFSTQNNQLDTRYWNVATSTMPIYNQEIQVYSSSSENVRVTDGKLILEARQNGNSLTSGRVDSKGKFVVESGSRLEASIKLPKGRGTWPAFWLLSENQIHTTKLAPNDGDWQKPRFYLWDGEIDIMEAYGNYPGSVEATVHTFANSASKTKAIPDSSDAFHTYWFEWQKDKLIFGVDRTTYHTYTKSSNVDKWPFTEDNKFYVIFNLAMGGSGGGQIVNSAGDNWQMEVQNIKYYRL